MIQWIRDRNWLEMFGVAALAGWALGLLAHMMNVYVVLAASLGVAVLSFIAIGKAFKALIRRSEEARHEDDESEPE